VYNVLLRLLHHNRAAGRIAILIDPAFLAAESRFQAAADIADQGCIVHGGGAHLIGLSNRRPQHQENQRNKCDTLVLHGLTLLFSNYV